MNVGVILTMNAPKGFYERTYEEPMERLLSVFRALNGTVEILPCCDTLQVADYSRFSMAGFSEAHKKEVHEKQFPRDLEAAFSLGARLGKGE